MMVKLFCVGNAALRKHVFLSWLFVTFFLSHLPPSFSLLEEDLALEAGSLKFCAGQAGKAGGQECGLAVGRVRLHK